MKEAQIKINVNFKIIPFGHALIEIRGHEEEKKVREKEIEIIFGEKNYTVPKTTGGFL